MTSRLVLILLVGSLAATAGSITDTFTISAAPTNWFFLLELDPYLGPYPLTSVELTLTGTVQGTVKVENTGSTPASAASQLASEIKIYEPTAGWNPSLGFPNSPTLIITFPLKTFTDDLETFDGTLDYEGPSAATNTSHAEQTVSATFDPGSPQWSIFLGTEPLRLPITAQGWSGVFGSGNTESSATTTATATGTITYHFDSPVPEPAVLTLVGGGLLGLAYFGRRRKRP